MAQGAQQVQPRLAQVQPGVKCVNVLLAFVDARLLLGCWRELGRRARCAGSAVAYFELGYDALQLLFGNLLFQAGDFCLGIQLAQARRQLADLNVILLLSLLGLHFGAKGLGR